MKISKTFILGIIFIFTGILGGGLFAIANSLNIIAAELSEKTAPANITCGLILFILLGVAITGLIILLCDVFGDKEKK